MLESFFEPTHATVDRRDGATSLPPCPPWLRPVSGLRTAGRVEATSAFAERVGGGGSDASSPAREAGLRFERKVQHGLRSVWRSEYEEQPLFRFVDDSGNRICRPDGILDTPWGSLVVEVKHSHTADAWWQLEHYYLPVVGLALRRPARGLVVVKRVDPAVAWPGIEEPLTSWHELEGFVRMSSARIGVLEWPGR